MTPEEGSNSADLVSVTSYLRPMFPGAVPANMTYNPNLAQNTFADSLILTSMPAGQYYLDINVTTTSYPYHWKGKLSFNIVALPATMGHGVSNMTAFGPMPALANKVFTPSESVSVPETTELSYSVESGAHLRMKPADLGGDRCKIMLGSVANGILQTNGDYLYTPKAGFSGKEICTYTVFDNKKARSAKLELNVTPPVVSGKAIINNDRTARIIVAAKSAVQAVAVQQAKVSIDWSRNADKAVAPAGLYRQENWLNEMYRQPVKETQSLADKTGLRVRLER
jgi:hypothetical protein